MVCSWRGRQLVGRSSYYYNVTDILYCLTCLALADIQMINSFLPEDFCLDVASTCGRAIASSMLYDSATTQVPPVKAFGTGFEAGQWHATGNRSTVVRIHVEAEERMKLFIQMSARAKQVKPLGNLTCIEMGSREYVLVILDCHSVEERTRIG